MASSAVHFHRDRICVRVSGTCIALSFLIYVWAVLVVNAQQRNSFMVERWSLAAAASNVYYGAPLGEMYTGVYHTVSSPTVPLDQALEQAAHQQVPPGVLQGSTRDGSGIGYLIYATVGMRLFGPHASSFVLCMLGLMASSAIAFVCRFRDARATVVILHFSVLTVMLFTPLVWDPNFSLGGFRYFSLMAILPGYHLWLECIDRSRFTSRMLDWTLLPMAVQAVIFGFAILCRNSAAPLIGAIVVGWAATAWRYRSELGSSARAWTKPAFAAIVAGTFIALLVLSISKTYMSQVGFTENIWHRIFVSLGVSPDWPFGNLREIYDCALYIPEGLVPGIPDRNGHCVFVVYAKAHNIPPEVFTAMTYGSIYETAVREAFFHVLHLYPYQVLKTFFYYKPLLIPWSITQSLQFKILEIPYPLTLLFFATLLNLMIFATAALARVWFGAQIGTGTALFAAFNSIPYLAAWAVPHTTADLLYFCLFAIGFGAVVAIAKSRETLVSALFRYNRRLE